jgi:hypothetical protein
MALLAHSPLLRRLCPTTVLKKRTPTSAVSWTEVFEIMEPHRFEALVFRLVLVAEDDDRLADDLAQRNRCWTFTDCLQSIGSRSREDLQKLFQIGGFDDEELGDPPRHLNWPNIAALAVWLLSVGTLLTRAVRTRKTLPTPLTTPAR